MASRWLRASLAAAAAVSVSVSATPIFRTTNVTTTTPPVYSNDTLVIDEYAPGYSGFNTVWQESFWGNAGAMVNEANWQIVTGLKVNNELQTYTRSNTNMQISGGGTLQIVPVLDHSTNQWTSGRVESWYTFTPADGRLTMAEAKIRFGDAPAANKQGRFTPLEGHPFHSKRRLSIVLFYREAPPTIHIS